jgi:hypothetical protein
MAIEGTGPASGVAPVQPRQQSSASSSTDNRAVQFTLDQDQAGASSAPAASAPAPNSPADKYQQASALSYSTASSGRDLASERIELPQSQPSQNTASAINYGASGAASTPNPASQAGRLVSLSV